MVSRLIAPAVAAAVAVVLVLAVPDSAGARGGGRGTVGGFRPAGQGAARFAARPFFHHGFVRSGANQFGPPFRRFLRFPHPLALPDGGLLYGAYDDGIGGAGPYAAAVDNGGLAFPPAQGNIQFEIYRPSCRLQMQTTVVPSEAGGERKIAITRCVSEWPPATRMDNGSLRQSGAMDEHDRRSPVSMAAGVPTERTDESDLIKGASCQIASQHVRAQDGGERTITIRRC
jgi:hypothetical protein